MTKFPTDLTINDVKSVNVKVTDVLHILQIIRNVKISVQQ